jgi:hypothetical protein
VKKEVKRHKKEDIDRKKGTRKEEETEKIERRAMNLTMKGREGTAETSREGV